MIAIFSLLTFIIAIFSISYVIYYLFYSRSINNRLKNNESLAHNSMVSVDTMGKFFTVVVGVVIVFILFGELSGLKSDIEAERETLSSQISDLEWQVSMLQDQVKEQDSLITDFTWKVDGFHPEDSTVDIWVSFMPKSYGKNTRITLRNGEHELEFVNDGDGYFTAEGRWPAFDRIEDETLISQEDDGIKRCIIEEYLFTDYLYKEAYSLDCGDSRTCTEIRTGIGGDKFDIQGNIMLGESCESMEQLELYVVKNEERIQDLEVEFPEVSFDTKFPAKRTDKAMLILKGIDENGYEHRRIVTMIGEFTDDYLSEERESIYNAEGSLMVGRTIPY